MEGRPEDIAKIKRIFPLEKCRKHLKIIRQLYKHGIEKKAQAPCMYDLLGGKYLVFGSSRSVKVREFSFLSLYTF